MSFWNAFIVSKDFILALILIFLIVTSYGTWLFSVVYFYVKLVFLNYEKEAG